MSEGFDKLVIPLPGGGKLVFVEAGREVSFGDKDCEPEGLPTGWLGQEETRGTELPPFALMDRGREQVLRVLETKNYRWRLVDVVGVTLESSLQGGPAEQWSVTRGEEGDDQEGSFQVVNQLGRASFVFSAAGRCALGFTAGGDFAQNRFR